MQRILTDAAYHGLAHLVDLPKYARFPFNEQACACERLNDFEAAGGQDEFLTARDSTEAPTGQLFMLDS